MVHVFLRHFPVAHVSHRHMFPSGICFPTAHVFPRHIFHCFPTAQFSALSESIQTNVTSPRQSFQPYRTRYKHTLPVLDNLLSLIGLDTKQHNRSSTNFSVLSDSIQTTLPVLDNLFSLIGLDSNKLYRSSTIFSALSDSIQITITGPRQSFQPYRTRYKQTLPVLDNLFSLIGLDTNTRYRSSTIFSVFRRTRTILKVRITRRSLNP